MSEWRHYMDDEEPVLQPGSIVTVLQTAVNERGQRCALVQESGVAATARGGPRA